MMMMIMMIINHYHEKKLFHLALRVLSQNLVVLCYLLQRRDATGFMTYLICVRNTQNWSYVGSGHKCTTIFYGLDGIG